MNKEKKTAQVNNTEQMNEAKQEKKEKKVVPAPWWKRKGTIAAGICLIALIAGLLVWQPWKKPAVPIEDPPITAEQEETNVDKSVAKEEPENKNDSTTTDDVQSGKVQKEEPKQGNEQQPAQENTQTTVQQQTQQAPAQQQTTEQTSVQQPTQQTPSQQQPTQETPAETHTHVWTEIYKTVHYDEVKETVHHDAVTEQRYVIDSPAVYQATFNCNCGFKTTSNDEMNNHVLNAPWDEDHNEWLTEELVSAEVGHYETVVVAEAYDEVVVKQPAYDEQVIDYYVCSGCGARK